MHRTGLERGCEVKWICNAERDSTTYSALKISAEHEQRAEFCAILCFI